MKAGQVNKTTFSKLVEENQGIIHKITRVYADGAEDREDLFQEICLQLWSSFHNFREEAKFSTWMYRVNLNQVSYHIKHMEVCLSDLNDNVLEVVSQNIELQQKQDRTTKFLLGLAVVFGFVLLIAILKSAGI